MSTVLASVRESRPGIGSYVVLSAPGDGWCLGEPVHYAGVAPPDRGAPYLSFQRVPEPKIQKNRSHLDRHVNQVDAVTALVERLGGSRDRDFDEYGYRWRLMRDTEGNEFCLVHLRPGDSDRGARLAPSGRLPYAGD